MGLFNFTKKKNNVLVEESKDTDFDSAIELNESKRVGSMKGAEQGSSGTMIFSGIFDEEYLVQLQGTERADLYDKMARSDDQVSMLLQARKNPIIMANWFIEAAGSDESEIRQKEFIERELFERSSKPFKSLLEEILSFEEHGYSLFEKVYEVVKQDPEFGDFLGLKKLAWRSQRTIEEFNLCSEDGSIIDVRQVVNGDLDRDVHMLGETLVVFTLNKLGDNYEGISALRPIYGNYKRKNVYHKLQAIGSERYAVPTPVGTVPRGKERTDEAQTFKNILSAISSHQRSYITKGEGWDIDFIENKFDSEKLNKVIQQENTQMAKSFMAVHLELGTGGNGGAYALGTDLSDQFLSVIQADADIITRTINNDVIKELIDYNFGKQASYPKLKVTGINDKLGKEFAEILDKLVGKKLITPNKSLEIFLRKEFKVPELTDEELEVVPELRQEEPQMFQLSETSKKTQASIKKEIDQGQDQLYSTMKSNLRKISDQYREEIRRKLKSTPQNKWSTITLEVEPRGKKPYASNLLSDIAEISANAVDQAKSEVKAEIKLAEKEDMEKLTPELRRTIRVESALVAGAQLNDLEKNVSFTLMGSIEETDSIDKIVDDVRESQEDYIESNAVRVAAANEASKAVNRARVDFFGRPSVLPNIVAFEFLNPDPKSAICKDLTGRIFRVDDPNSREFLPPLHHNCKSFIAPVYDNDVEITSLEPSRAELKKDITL